MTHSDNSFDANRAPRNTQDLFAYRASVALRYRARGCSFAQIREAMKLRGLDEARRLVAGGRRLAKAAQSRGPALASPRLGGNVASAVSKPSSKVTHSDNSPFNSRPQNSESPRLVVPNRAC